MNAMGTQRVIWKIVVGAILVIVSVVNLPLYLNGSAQANGGLTMSMLAIAGGFFLIYRGFYPKSA
jgi:hypothetical protein